MKKKVAGIPVLVWVTVAILIGTVVAATLISNILTGTTTLAPPQYWGTFYYSWYCDGECLPPYTWWHWNESGHYPPDNWASKFLADDGSGLSNPASELYSSRSTTVIKRHLTWMDYARLDFSLVSWWGPTGRNSFQDKALRLMLTEAQNNATLHLKLAAYYELEGAEFPQPTVDEIVGNLTYIWNLAKNFTSYFRVGPNRYPVVFVYGNASDTFDYTNRWSSARDIMIAKEQPMFIVLKVFSGYTQNGNDKKVDGWHQYRPDVNVRSPLNCEPINCNSFPHYELQEGYSALATPGFWSYSEDTPRLNRSTTGFAIAVATMASLDPHRAQFLLIETFNEWHEGTQVEPGIPVNTDVSPFTQADSTYGFDYLNIIKNRG